MFVPAENFLDADLTQEPTENSPGVDLAQEPTENSPGVDPVQGAIGNPDLADALAEIARLRMRNQELLEQVRSQSQTIRHAKDISPVEKPSFKRVLALAEAALLNLSKGERGAWFLSMGHLKRKFGKLRHIWDLLTAENWYLSDLFPPSPPVVSEPLFPLNHSKYGAVPFCDDDWIDSYALGFAGAESSGRSPPEVMRCRILPVSHIPITLLPMRSPDRAIASYHQKQQWNRQILLPIGIRKCRR
ncbi:hypothetical protein IQ269_19275 [Tychonema sp. LEGE 07199]|uniref:hypothetical protein n=1 Tax=unclassified Tychonema TaxID=2642144 RepID=UPI00188069F3|nr:MULTISPECIES: hypothetical protein [unclassified Tychonema]MBE9122880.1 hypothetical protein [Tychonema sp. LEGE 07199]MBE9134735.1 hypothetical protein [Tychonema sp. LEGE 07196]